MTTVTTITGDITKVRRGTILHQVNCRGVLGGLAGALHRAHPAAFVDYLVACDKYGARLAGSYIEGHASRELSIVHVFGQVDPGPCTDIAMVNAAFASMSGRPYLMPIYAPFRMGCGIGGGNWADYLSAITRVFHDVVIVQREEDAQ